MGLIFGVLSAERVIRLVVWFSL